jgi:hypothetical protein
VSSASSESKSYCGEEKYKNQYVLMAGTRQLVKMPKEVFCPPKCLLMLFEGEEAARCKSTLDAHRLQLLVSGFSFKNNHFHLSSDFNSFLFI